MSKAWAANTSCQPQRELFWSFHSCQVLDNSSLNQYHKEQKNCPAEPSKPQDQGKRMTNYFGTSSFEVLYYAATADQSSNPAATRKHLWGRRDLVESCACILLVEAHEFCEWVFIVKLLPSKDSLTPVNDIIWYSWPYAVPFHREIVTRRMQPRLLSVTSTLMSQALHRFCSGRGQPPCNSQLSCESRRGLSKEKRTGEWASTWGMGCSCRGPKPSSQHPH